MLEEFKKFLFKGDVVALSTGVLIGAAFGKIVDGFTKGIVDPIMRLFGGGPNVSGLSFKISEFKEKVKEGGVDVEKILPNNIDLGLIVNAIIGFVITAAIIFFLIVKPLSKMSAKMASAPPPPPDDVKLLTEIRDLLKK